MHISIVLLCIEKSLNYTKISEFLTRVGTTVKSSNWNKRKYCTILRLTDTFRQALLDKIKGYGLGFFTVNFASAQELPFGITQYLQYILQGLTGVLLCVPFMFADMIIFADNGECQFGGSFHCVPEVIHMFLWLQWCFLMRWT